MTRRIHSQRMISLRWIVVSYFIIAGAMFAFHLCNSILLERDHTALYGTYGFAGFIGGFLAGRASRTKTILEPALAGLLVVLSLYVFALVIDLGHFLKQLDSLEVPISQALIAFAAAVAGGKLGERMQPKGVPVSKKWWAGLTALIVIGTCFMVSLLVGTLCELLDADLVSFIGVALLFSTPIIGGAVTQIAAPFPIAGKMPFMSLYWSVGTALVALSADSGTIVIAAFFWTLFAGLLCSALAALGATMVCKYAPSWLESDVVQLTTARALDAD